VLGSSLGSLVGKGREWSSKIAGGANGGRRRVAELFELMRKGSMEGLIGPGACRGGCSIASWPTGAKEWARGGGDVRRGRRLMAEGGARGGESVVAAWHRPKPPRMRHEL
jgi:hypothetical protein